MTDSRLSWLLSALFVLACGSSDHKTSGDSTVTGGFTAISTAGSSGGATSGATTTGVNGSGGNASSGGATSSTSADSTGGVGATGGSIANGGTVSNTGGNSPSGGALPTGGRSSSGGSVASTGGILGSGGVTASGGAVSTGGSHASTGGNSGSGGMTASGGAVSTGGSHASTGGESSSGGTVANGGTTTTGGMTACTGGSAAGGDTSNTTPMPANTKIGFLHHSTGGVIWGGGVPDWFTAYNQSHSTTYEISEMAYPDSPYPWANYPYDYWNLWVNHSGTDTEQDQATLETLTQQYQVIVWKHCFPVSSVVADTGNPNITSSTQTQENYKLQYAALAQKMHGFQNIRFIVWTGAALRQADTDEQSATRAREFFTWVKTTWDKPGDNIFVWDFRQLETEGGLYLTPANASGDSHPNETFATRVAPYFAQRVVDVIEGRGDSGSITGH